MTRESSGLADKGRALVWAETEREGDDNESEHDARKSEGENVAHVMTSDTSSCLICGQGDGLRRAPITFLIGVLLGVNASSQAEGGAYGEPCQNNLFPGRVAV